MDAKKLYEVLKEYNYSKSDSISKEWKKIISDYVSEKNADYLSLEINEAVPRLISEQNLRARRNAQNCAELGVDIRIGDICFIDFGEAYINEIGYQHFGLILTISHNKAFVVPMSGNHQAFLQAYSSNNLCGKKHLMRLGKIAGMNKKSVLFINDAKFINTARIIDVKAHLNRDSILFKEIAFQINECLGLHNLKSPK